MGDVAQALYGYGQGHQLLAASLTLPAQSARQLRAVTDMAFDGRAETYLTAMPLPEIGRYALIRTWPAPESPRRGSVWSHALLVDLVAFSALEDPTVLVSLFRRPESDQQKELKLYERDLSLSEARSVSRLPASGQRLDDLLWAVYGSSDPAVVRADRADEAEVTLLAIWRQQWPRLRRAFSFRTRYRVSSRSDAFDVQLVERLERDQPPATPPEPKPEWVGRLREAVFAPDDEISAFLRRFGPESPEGRRDLHVLVEVAALIEDGFGSAVVRLVGSSFDTSDQMPTLKRYLLGRPESSDRRWAAPEKDRLMMLLRAKPAAAFSLEDLKVEARFDALWRWQRRHGGDLLSAVEFSRSENAAVRDALLGAAAFHALPADLAAVSESNPEAAIAIVKQRIEILVEPTLWQGDPALVDFLLDLLGETRRETRVEILAALLAGGVIDAAARLIEREPDLWWSALEWAAAAGKAADQAAELLDRLLNSVGAGAIGAMPKPKQRKEVLKVLATCVSPSLGLWRQVKAEEWLELAPRWKSIDERWAQLRMLIVLLAAAKSAGNDVVRRGLWCAAFPPLHEALVNEELKGPDLGTLVGLLPQPSGIAEWDHGGRLRAALAIEIRRGSWPQDEIAEVVRAAEPYEEALLKALAAGKKKKKSWLRELADAILP